MEQRHFLREDWNCLEKVEKSLHLLNESQRLTILNLSFSGNGNTNVVKFLMTKSSIDREKLITILMISENLKLSFEMLKTLIDSLNLEHALQVALTRHGSLDVWKYLVEEKGFDVNKPTDYDMTPLNLLCYEGKLDIVKYLIESGYARINGTSKHKQTPLWSCAYKNRLELAKYLVEKGAALDIVDFCGKNCLSIAVDCGYLEMAKFLIGVGVDVNNSDYKKVTPLFTACDIGRLDLVKVLVENGADLNFQNANGETCLWIASAVPWLEIVEYLAKSPKILLNLSDNQGQTALSVAAWEGNLEIVEALVKMGADLSLSDLEGLSPLEIAISRKHKQIEQFLKDQMK